MKEYKISVNPRILELLGPNLYTNIYYVLAELIANAYDADAHTASSFSVSSTKTDAARTGTWRYQRNIWHLSIGRLTSL